MKSLCTFLLFCLFLTNLTAQYGFEWIVSPQFESNIYSDSPDYYAFVKNGKVGITDRFGKTIIPFKYDPENGVNIMGKYAQFGKNGLQGLIDLKTGKTALPFEYESIYRIYDYTGKVNTPILVFNGGKSGLLDFETLKPILPIEFQQINPDPTNEVILAQKNNLWGLYDWAGKLLFSHNYKQIQAVNKSEFLVCKQMPGTMTAYYYEYNAETPEKSSWLPTQVPTLKWGLINKQGKNLIPFRHLYLSNLGGGAFAATSEGKIDTTLYLIESFKMSIINNEGKELVPTAKMTAYGNFTTSTFIIEKDSLQAVFDSTGHQLCPFQYTELWSSGDDFSYTAKRNGKMGHLDKFGKEIYPFKYESLGGIVNGRTWATLEGKNGFIDKKGNWLFDSKYESVYILDSLYGYPSTNINEETGTAYFGVIDLKTGKEIIPVECMYYGEEDSPGYENGFIRCCDKNEKLRIYNEKGKNLTFNRFQCNYGQFSEGLISVHQDGHGFGFIDNNGKTIIPCVFEEASPFVNGKSVVKKDGKYGIIALNKPNKLKKN
jgi:WG containing repeat